MPNTYEIFSKIIDSKGLTPYRVAKDTGLTTVLFTDWKKGKSKPKYEKLKVIADYLGVSIDYLLGKSETPSPAAISFTAEENAIISALRAQPEMKPAVLRLLGLDSGSE